MDTVTIGNVMKGTVFIDIEHYIYYMYLMANIVMMIKITMYTGAEVGFEFGDKYEMKRIYIRKRLAILSKIVFCYVVVIIV